MTAYTKRHYTQLARIVCVASYDAAERIPSRENTAEREANARIVRQAFAEALAVAFANDNPRFDASKWFEACASTRG